MNYATQSTETVAKKVGAQQMLAYYDYHRYYSSVVTWSMLTPLKYIVMWLI